MIFRKHTLIGFLLTIFVSTVLHAQTAETQASKLTITTGEWAPYSSQFLPHNGFAIHIIEEALKRQSISVKLGFMPWGRAMSRVEYGEWQASAVWVKSPEREEKFLFSVPVLEDRRHIIVRADSTLKWLKPSDLKGKRLGYILSSEYPLFGPTLRDNGNNTLVFPSYKLAFQAILNGRIDAFPATEQAWRYTVKRHFPAGTIEQLKTAGKGTELLPFHLIVAKTTPNAEQIIENFNNGMTLLRQSGRYDELLADLKNGVYES